MLRQGVFRLLRNTSALRNTNSSLVHGVVSEPSVSGTIAQDTLLSARSQLTQLRWATGFSRIIEHEKGQTKFHGYYAGGFYVNNVQVPGSVIAQRDMYMMWRPRTMEEVTPESMAFLELIKPKPEVVVIGCGLTTQPLPKDVAAYIKSLGLLTEVLDSRNAPGYFNVLNEDGRIVVGFLLAPDPTVPLAEVMPEQPAPVTDLGRGR